MIDTDTDDDTDIDSDTGTGLGARWEHRLPEDIPGATASPVKFIGTTCRCR